MSGSTRRLSDIARQLVVPSGITSTGWPAAEHWLRKLGLPFDVWQQGVAQVALGKRADGQYACTVGGVFLSIPRQVGKTYMVGGLAFALCLMSPHSTFIWTAHRTKTAAETYKSMKGMARRRAIEPYIDKTPKNNDEWGIFFANGSRILFGARENGFGRGFAKVDGLVFDEAQILTDKALDDMIPAMNASSHPSGGLPIFMGTPPRPGDASEVWMRAREEALSGESDDLLWVEFAPRDRVDPAKWPPGYVDFEAFAEANPSYPVRTPRAAILRMAKRLSKDSLSREGLGQYDEALATAAMAVDLDLWRNRTIDIGATSLEWPLAAVGLDMDLSGRAWVSVAAHAEDPNVHVELLPGDLLEDGSDAAVRWLWERCRKRRPVVMPADSGATVLEAPLLAKGVKVYRLNVVEQAQASMSLVQALTDAEVSHLGDEVLEQAVREAPHEGMKQGLWRIGRAGELSSAPLLALAAARFGAVKWSRRSAVRREGSVVVL